MTRDSWDWGFASLAEDKPAPNRAQATRAPGPDLEKDEPAACRPRTAEILAASGALEDHLFNLQAARTHDERRAAAEEALRFLARRGRRVDDDPTLVDRTTPESVPHERAGSLASDSAPR